MGVKFLKAGNGDAILIQHGNKNILIDGGNDESYLLEQLAIIYQDSQHIDLLIVTHHDDDHIRGVLKFMSKVEAGEFGSDGFVKRIIFNSPKTVTSAKLDQNLLSYRQAYELDQILDRLNLSPELAIAGMEMYKDEGIKLTALAPFSSDLLDYASQKGAYLSTDFKCDWTSPMGVLDRFIDDDYLDKSIPNRSSIVIKVDIDKQIFLLTADVTPDVLEKVLEKLMIENDGKPIRFNYVKLPHHGSYRNLSEKILKSINCTDFIVTTNSLKYFLPNKRAVLKLCKWLDRGSRSINLYFNYSEGLSSMGVTEAEKKKYRLKLIPNNKKYGYDIG